MALSEIFRAKFRDLIKQAHLFDQIPAEVWHIDWNVNCQAVSSSEASLKYLAPYVFKVAISNSRIVKVQDRTVLIRYRKSHSERSRILPLEVMEFIRRFLQHVLPTGFMKIRYYGFMNPNCAVPLDRIRGLIEISYGFAVDLPKSDVESRRPNTFQAVAVCSNCAPYCCLLPEFCGGQDRRELDQPKINLAGFPCALMFKGIRRHAPMFPICRSDARFSAVSA